MRILEALALSAFVLAACRPSAPAGRDCAVQRLTPGASYTCRVPGWPDRDFVLRIPEDGAEPRPLVLALHGGGGRKEGMDAVTCADGRAGDPACLSTEASKRGVVLVLPDGLANRMGRRGWNDGPARGADGHEWRCGYPCEQGVDDVAYVRALLDEVARLTPIDPRRVYATGLSNGAGMSHRLACELADRIAAIAAVGGGNRLAATSPCEPARAVPVLQIHGDADPVWPYLGGESDVAFIGGRFPPIPPALTGGGLDRGWVARDGCDPTPAEATLPDLAADGTTSTMRRWSGCRDGVEVALLTVHGGGHTWPGGDAYLAERTVGRVARDFSASSMALDFLLRWRLPE